MGWDETDREISTCSECGMEDGTRRVFITPCGHTICETCKGASLSNQQTVSCSGCEREKLPPYSYKESELVPGFYIPLTGARRYLADPSVGIERNWRMKVHRVYWRPEKSFKDDPETGKTAAMQHNDWLDMMESKIRALASKNGADAILEEMRQYEQEHKHRIEEEYQPQKRLDDKYLEETWGKVPLPWQRAPAPSVHRKSVPAPPPKAETVGAAHPPVARPQARQPQPSQSKPEPFWEAIPQDEIKATNRELRERAGGFTREDQQRRDRDAGLPTLRATLKRRLAL